MQQTRTHWAAIASLEERQDHAARRTEIVHRSPDVPCRYSPVLGVWNPIPLGSCPLGQAMRHGDGRLCCSEVKGSLLATPLPPFRVIHDQFPIAWEPDALLGSRLTATLP